MKSTFFYFGILFFSQLILAQKPEYTHLLIDQSLKENANAVVRLDEKTISILAQNSMTVESKVVTTVLNDFGLRSLHLYESFDNNTKISKLEVTVYDGFGKEIKSFKKKDFRDISVADGFSVFSDNRALVLNYTPITYPFTIVFESFIETSNTVFVPSWMPLDDFYVSVESSKFKLKHAPELKVNRKELNFIDGYKIESKISDSEILYAASNIIAKKGEQLTPSILKIFPSVIFGLEKFYLEGIEGAASTWQEMGKWFYDKILNGTSEIPQETILKVKKLVENETDDIKKAEIIYKYVQEKTRYVSIQEGIGGWKPMNAKDVDKLGYGDCKALSNYTRSLLNEVGVKSYYARLYGQSSIREIQTDIVSFQSNHVILAIPKGNDYIWLECTSQIQPFGFQGDFTDDRNVLIIKPEGGEIVKTKTFTEKDNYKKLEGFYKVSVDGNIKANVKMVSYGIQYDDNFKKERLSKEDQIKYYKEEFNHINNLKVNQITFSNNKEKIEFTEEVNFEAESYAQNMGGKLMFALNAFNQSSAIPKKHRNREFPFEIQRGYTDEDETIIEIPEGYQVEAMPNDVELTSEYGSYKIEFKSIDKQKIKCNRKLIIHKGFYESSKFEEYRKFRETIGRSDNSKVVIFKS